MPASPVDDAELAAEREVFADAWAGKVKTRRPGAFRSFRCKRQGLLSQDNVTTITSVTFLSPAEVKNLEVVFQYIVQNLEPGERKYVTRLVPIAVAGADADRATRTDVETRTKIIALTEAQLRNWLPEFHHNVFFGRLVRVFSESGEQLLTLVELLDLYSTLSHRAPVEWKARACFCVFDWDEDNKLCQQDLKQTLGRMVRGTHRSSRLALSKEEAAVSIQRLYRGFQERRKVLSLGPEQEGQANVPTGKSMDASGHPRHSSARAAQTSSNVKADSGKPTKLDRCATPTIHLHCHWQRASYGGRMPFVITESRDVSRCGGSQL
jgi:hypothetical protein